MVLAYADNGASDFPYRFRTYRTRTPLKRAKRNRREGTIGAYGDAQAVPIWQVARATLAAPTHFPPIEIPRDNHSGFMTFRDGGVDSNNPSEVAYYDIIAKHGGKSQKMGPFLSIGTGIPSIGLYPPIEVFSKKKRNCNNAIANLKAVLSLPSRTFGAHRKMEKLSMSGKKQDHFPYFRFDGPEGLGEIALEEWKGRRFTWLTGKDERPGCTTLERIDVATAAYLAEPKVQEDLRQCAKILVRRKHLRMRDSSEWDRYASFSYYDCNVQGCDRTRNNKADDFREHLRKFHQKTAEQEIEQRVRDCRRVYWKYRSHAPDSTLPAG